MMIGLAILLSLGGIVTSLLSSFMGYLDKTLGADYLFLPQSLVLTGGNVGAGPEFARRILNTPGVASVTTLRVALSRVDNTSLQLIGIDPQTYPVVSGLEFTAGDETAAYDLLSESRALIVNGIFAAQHQVKVGDKLTLLTPEGTRDYNIVGIGLDYLNAKLATAYISQANLETDFHMTEDLLVMARKLPEADGEEVRTALHDLVAEYPAFTLLSAQEWRDSQKTAFDGAMVFLYVLMIAITSPSLIALINTLVINILERTREIGTLRAVGSTRRQIRRMILAESLLLAGMGTAFGILAGLWLGYALVGAINVSGFSMDYNFPLLGILIVIAVGLIFGVLASLIPARQAAKMEIVQALRYE